MTTWRFFQQYHFSISQFNSFWRHPFWSRRLSEIDNDDDSTGSKYFRIPFLQSHSIKIDHVRLNLWRKILVNYRLIRQICQCFTLYGTLIYYIIIYLSVSQYIIPSFVQHYTRQFAVFKLFGIIFLSVPLLAINLCRHRRNWCADKSSTNSKCMAQTARHVNKHTHTFLVVC